MINLIGISGKMGNGKDTVANIIQYLCDQLGEVTQGGKYFGDTTLEDCLEFIKKNESLSYPDETSWEIKSFAAKLKEIASMLIGLPLETFKTQEGKLKVLDSMWDYYTLEYHEEGDIKIPKFNSYEEAVDFIKTNFNIITQINFIPRIQHHQMTVREVLQLVGTDCMRDNLHQNVWVNSLFSDYKLSELNTSAARFPEDIEIGEKVIPQYPKWLIPDTRFLNEAKAIRDRGGIVLRVNRDIASNTNTHPSETALDNYQFDYIINNNGTLEELIEEIYKFLKHYKII